MLTVSKVRVPIIVHVAIIICLTVKCEERTNAFDDNVLVQIDRVD